MSYVALYRKWRPMVFDDVVEQEHIVKSLKYSVCNDRIAHAYLFSGTRGTGKTTMAHILSRAINCLDLQDGNPCNNCKICKGIISGSILDVIEIDAASNNSVDNVREIRDEVVYAPSQAKYKVYIIDEVHMLSSGAFNALLKTLEEPPSRVIFILATTEPHKLPATILSRCQRYDFRRITSLGISKHLKKIALANNISIEKEALNLIARLSDGALRDALSVLDQCISTGSENITYQNVLSVTGMVNETFISSFAEVLNKDLITECLTMVNDLIMEGKDITQFVLELTIYYRNLLICNIVEEPSKIIETSKEALEIMKSQAKLLERSFIINIIQELSTLEASLKWASQPRIMLEVALIKICSSSLILSTNSTKAALSYKITEPAKVKQTDEVKEPLPANKVNQSSEFHKTIEEAWERVLNELSCSGKRPLCICLGTGKAVPLSKNSIGIVFPEERNVNKQIASQADNLQLIEKSFKSILGRDIRVRCMIEEDLPQSKPTFDSNDDDCANKIIDFADKYNIPINIIDE